MSKSGKTIEHTGRLGDRTLTISILEPPLDRFGYGETIEYWWRDVRTPLLNGELSETSLDRFVVGELDGEYVGSMTYATPATRETWLCWVWSGYDPISARGALPRCCWSTRSPSFVRKAA